MCGVGAVGAPDQFGVATLHLLHVDLNAIVGVQNPDKCKLMSSSTYIIPWRDEPGSPGSICVWDDSRAARIPTPFLQTAPRAIKHRQS